MSTIHPETRTPRFRATQLVTASAAVILAVSALGCAEESIPDAPEDTHEDTRDVVLDGLRVHGDWELAPNRAVIATEAIDDQAFVLTEDERVALAAAAEQDPTWYAADGTRYEAMYVLPDGTAYGRRGGAPEMPLPSAENDFGKFRGTEAPTDADDDGAGEGSVYTDVSQDQRIRRTNSYPFLPLTQFPTRANGAMSDTGGTLDSGCSGTKIGPRAVLTAAHCVLKPDGTWITSGYFNPGQTNAGTPNGSHAWAGVIALDWRIDRKYDYGVFYATDSAAFYNLGWLGVEWYTAGSYYNGMTSKNRGYPCGPNNACGSITAQRCADSARADLRCDGWMYGMDLAMTSAAFAANDLLAYHNDVSFGHSGSAIYNENSNILGVVTHQECPNGSCQWYDPAHGPRFRQSMWNDVCSWIANTSAQSGYGQHPLCHP